MKLSVIIPTYNEEKTIEETLKKILDFFRQKGWEFEVIVSDDGSLDKTCASVQALQSANREIRLLKNEHKGKGYAVFSGVNEAVGDYLYLCDADLSTPIEEFDKLWSKLHEAGLDIVVASRAASTARRIGEPFYRNLMGRVFNFIVQLLVIRGISDTQCGFKLLRREAARKIFPRLQLYGGHAKKIKGSAVTAYDVELLFLAKKFNFKMAEVGVIWYFRNETRVHPIRDTWRNFWDVVRVRVNEVKGLYD